MEQVGRDFGGQQNLDQVVPCTELLTSRLSWAFQSE